MIGRGRDLSVLRDRMEFSVKAHERIRLDVYLREALVWKSRKRIQALIRAGHITVNGRPAKPSQGVRGGDRIEVRLSAGTGVPDDYEKLQVPVIYEDPWLVAVNKPPGLLVHPVGRHVYDTLMNYLHFRYRKEETPQAARGAAARRDAAIDESTAPRLCHRVDKETTGVLLVAKEKYVHERMGLQFRARAVAKEYLALAAGRIPPEREEIDLPIGEGRDIESALAPPLRPARTLIRAIERFSGPSGEFTLVSARPVTGRQNQIRIHLAAIAHPIAGDGRFGGPLQGEFPARYLLHARRIRFFHPRLKCAVEIEAEPPEDFQDLLARLRAQTGGPG